MASCDIDLGQISEDVVPNGRLDTEDIPLTGMTTGNGYLDPGEDTGLFDSLLFDNGELHPEWDEWSYNPSNPYDVWHINGTKTNGNDEGGKVPDTEDLNHNYTLDPTDNFFRYTIDLSEVTPAANYTDPRQGGNWYPSTSFLVNTPNTMHWKLYRIPLDANIPVGNPSMTLINYVRVWVDGFSDSTDHYDVSLATLEIVGNEWEAVHNTVDGDTTNERLSVEVINTYDNPSYRPPPGVAGYVDPITNIVSQEQSLMLKINDLPKDSLGLAVHTLYDSQDYLEYKKLKMFVHGGGLDTTNTEEMFNVGTNGIWMYFRFGTDTTYNYYEYRQRVWGGWDPDNNIEITLADLTQLKTDRPNPLAEYAIPYGGGGDTLAIKGNPSLSQIRMFVAGIIPRDGNIAAVQGMQIWLDELRVSEVKKAVGRKGRASADITLADLATLHVNMDASDGNFHNINERRQLSPANTLNGAASGTLQLQKFLNPKWGLNLPVSANYSKQQSTPYYFIGSDILVDKSNPLQLDTVQTINTTFGGGIDISKTIPSTSNWLKYSIDKLSGGYDYAKTERKDPYYQFSNSTTHSANLAYNLTFGRPAVMPLKWISTVPVLKKYSNTKVYPLITKLNLTVNGTEGLTSSRLRAGTDQFQHTFSLTKSVASGLHPFENLTIDVNRTHKADLLRNPNHPKGVSDILKGDLGWSDDNDVTQTVTSSYTSSVGILAGYGRPLQYFLSLELGTRIHFQRPEHFQQQFNFRIGYFEIDADLQTTGFANARRGLGNTSGTELHARPIAVRSGERGQPGTEPDDAVTTTGRTITVDVITRTAGIAGRYDSPRHDAGRPGFQQSGYDNAGVTRDRQTQRPRGDRGYVVCPPVYGNPAARYTGRLFANQ